MFKQILILSIFFSVFNHKLASADDYISYDLNDAFKDSKPGNSAELNRVVTETINGKRKTGDINFPSKEAISSLNPVTAVTEDFDRFFLGILNSLVYVGNELNFQAAISEYLKFGIMLTIHVMEKDEYLNDLQKTSKQKFTEHKIKIDFSCKDLDPDDDVQKICKQRLGEEIRKTLKLLDEKQGTWVKVKIGLIPIAQKAFVFPIAQGLSLLLNFEGGGGPYIEMIDFYESSVDFIKRNPLYRLPMRIKQLEKMQEGESIYFGGHGHLLIGGGLSLGFNQPLPATGNASVSLNLVNNFMFTGDFALGFTKGKNDKMKFTLRKNKNIANNLILFTNAGFSYNYDSIVNFFQSSLFRLPVSQALLNAGFLAQKIYDWTNLIEYDFDLKDLVKQNEYPVRYFLRNLNKSPPWVKQNRVDIKTEISRMQGFLNLLVFHFLLDHNWTHTTETKTSADGKVIEKDTYVDEKKVSVYSEVLNRASATVITNEKKEKEMSFTYAFDIDKSPYVYQLEKFLKYMKANNYSQYSKIPKEYYPDIHESFKSLIIEKNDEIPASFMIRKYHMAYALTLKEADIRAISVKNIDGFQVNYSYFENTASERLFGRNEIRSEYEENFARQHLYKEGTRTLLAIKELQDIKDQNQLAERLLEMITTNELTPTAIQMMYLYSKGKTRSSAFVFEKRNGKK